MVDVNIEYSGKAPGGLAGGAIFAIILVVVLIPAMLGLAYIKRDEIPTWSTLAR